MRTLLVDANGGSIRGLLADTLLQGVLQVNGAEVLRGRPKAGRFARKLFGQRNETLSYAFDWREAFERCPAIETRTCNLLNLVEMAWARRAVAESPLIVLLHLTNGDSMRVLGRMARFFRRRRGKLVVFVGNEYDLMSEKIAFMKAAGADFICTQLRIETSRWLYAECDSAQVIAMPHALNPSVYVPSMAPRPIDLGFIGSLYPSFLGDTERTDFVVGVTAQARAAGFHVSFSTERVERSAWAAFLGRCKGVPGAEAGSYYLDRRCGAMTAAREYVAAHPNVSIADLHERFFKPLTEYVSGKCVSSRHFEAIGAKACQLLLEGAYNGILKADEHYIEVKRDLSNLPGALARLMDEGYRQRLVDRTYEYVMDAHTYDHRVRSLLETVGVV